MTRNVYLILSTTLVFISSALAMDYNSVLTTDMSHLVSWKFKPIYYTARGLKKIHDGTGDFTVGLRLPRQTTINHLHTHNPNSIATSAGHVVGGLLKYSIPRTIIPFALSYLHREATNIFFNYMFLELLPSKHSFWTGFDYRTLCPNLISFALTLAAGTGTAYWLSKDGMHLCSKLLEKDPRLFAEIHSTQPTNREYNAQQIHELEYFINKHLHEPEKVAKIKRMFLSKNDDLGACFKNSTRSYSQRLTHCSLLKAAIRNRNHTLEKIIKTFGHDTVSIANEASRSFNIENCMICQESMDNYKNLTDFSCNFHSIHQHCFNDLQENYYQGKSDPDKRRCILCT